MDLRERLAEYPMTEVIAQRELTLTTPQGKSSVVMSIGRPALMKDGVGDWYCPYQVAGLDRDIQLFGVGVDSFQALAMAIAMLRDDAELFSREGNLRWLDEADPFFATGWQVANWSGPK